MLNLPSHMKYFWMTIRSLEKSSLWKVLEILVVISIPFCTSLRNSSQFCNWNFYTLNHIYSYLDIFVWWAMVWGDTAKFNMPTLDFVPLKLMENYFEIFPWYPCNFWQNRRHPILENAWMKVGYRSSNLMSMGSCLTTDPPLYFFLRVAMAPTRSEKLPNTCKRI